MTSFLPDHPVVYILGGLAVGFMILSQLARAKPNVRWLQPFRLPELSDAQKRRAKRRANLIAGAEMILAGAVVPLVYIAMTVMLFNDFTRTGIAIVSLISIALIGMGIAVLVKSRD